MQADRLVLAITSSSEVPPGQVNWLHGLQVCGQLNGNSANSDQLEKLQTVRIPFLDGLSQEVRRIARAAGVRCAFYTPNTLQSLYQTKDTLPQETEMNVVYAVKCQTCDDVDFSCFRAEVSPV